MSDVEEENRRLATHARATPSAARCWSCGHAIDGDDHYCRRCGLGQGAFLPWYYRPLWIVVLALTALGPLALPLVWRTPRLGRTGKWITSVVVVAVSAYVAWEFVVAVREVGNLLGGM
jgi:ribosomal protein L32